ncbi:hypothetical protein TMatcc_006625 [Talaromyces marneffei ATCC 18224]|nr:hypothetical protein EYB25_002427 [Talaromyces marneffei]
MAKSFRLSVLYALGLAASSMAGTNNYINLYDNHNCTTPFTEMAISHNEACLNSLSGDKLARASSGVLIEKGCFILGYENAQCNGSAVNMTWTNATDCFTPSRNDAYFEAFQLMNCD